MLLLLLGMFRRLLTIAAAVSGVAVGYFLYTNDADPNWQIRLLTSSCLGLACSVVVLFFATKVHELEVHLRRPRSRGRGMVGVREWGPNELPSLR